MTKIEINIQFNKGYVEGKEVNFYLPKDVNGSEGLIPKTLSMLNFIGSIPFVGTVSAALKFTVGVVALTVLTIALPIMILMKKNELANKASGWIGITVGGLPYNLLEAIPVIGTILHFKQHKKI